MKKLILILFVLAIVPFSFAQEEGQDVYPPPQYATDQTFALVSVNRANLRTAPSVANGVVVDIAMWGERYPIVGIFYPGESTVIEPGTEDFVFDDVGEREVWYLLDTGSGDAWIFGGLVLIANPDGLNDLLERNITPEQRAAIDAQLALASGTLAVAGNARLRNGPGTAYSQIGIIPSSARVSVIGRNQFSTWFYVNYNGAQGWVNFYLLEIPSGYDATRIPVLQ